MRDVKEIKVLHTDTEVNEYLEKGWILLRILDKDYFVIARESVQLK